MQRFRDGLAFKADRLLYHSTLGLRVIKKRKTKRGREDRALDGPASEEKGSKGRN